MDLYYVGACTYSMSNIAQLFPHRFNAISAFLSFLFDRCETRAANFLFYFLSSSSIFGDFDERMNQPGKTPFECQLFLLEN